LTDVYLEVGDKRVFACAVDWPGWVRAGKSEEQALAALAGYAPRYAAVARTAAVTFPKNAADKVDVVERAPGSATTEFGAPGTVPKLDATALTSAQTRRLAALVEAAWTVFDGVVAGAPASLRKGPRGGGRDRDKIVEHVLGAEAGYARQVGVRIAQPAADDKPAIAAARAELLDALKSPREGAKWPPRYAARRMAWHVLDHAWEIEDRSEG
jgi:hypothetical protein